MRWVYSPSRTVRMPPKSVRTRRERNVEKAPNRASTARQTTTEMSRRFRCNSPSKAPWSPSVS